MIWYVMDVEKKGIFQMIAQRKTKAARLNVSPKAKARTYHLIPDKATIGQEYRATYPKFKI